MPFSRSTVAIGIDDSEADVRERLRILSGQRLERVEYERQRATLIWHFDLGAAVVLRPIENAKSDDELWNLFEPDGLVFALRAGGEICHSPGDTPGDAAVWVPDLPASG